MDVSDSDFEDDVDEPPEYRKVESAISSVKQRPMTITSGLISKAKYLHKSKNCDIQSVTYNSKTGDYIIVDSRGITAWAKSFAADKTSRLMEFAAYQFNVIKILLYCRKFNVYFALSKDYQLKVYNLNFHETVTVESDTNSVIHMLFNAETNELITASTGELQCWQFGEISNQNDLLHAKYGLILMRKWAAADGKLISRIRLDEELQRLYCLSEKDVWCYDIMGKLIFKITEACQVHLSACAYSIPIHTLIIGSIDGQVNVLTTDGGIIHTFYSHVGLITEILVHPSDVNLMITSSLDGCIKIFSLDIFEELYSLRVFDNGIEYMALRSDDLLYCASVREIEIFNLNYFYQFWGQLRYPAQRIELVKNAQKSRRVLALAEDGSVRLFADTNGRKLCTVLPPPSVSATSWILDCVHDRDYNLVYLLVKTSEVWVYTTKTDPACHLAIVDLWDRKPGKANIPLKSSNYSKAVFLEEIINCNCIEVLQDLMEKEFIDANGVVHDTCNVLACGMDSGEIVLYNPLRSGQKEKIIKLCKDPIIKMKYYRADQKLMLLTKAKEGVFIQIFNNDLHCIVSVGCNDDLNVFSLKNMMLATGFASGHVLTLDLSTKEQKSLELVKASVDHQSSVQSVSFHPTLDILCSSAKYCCIKFWTTDKILLCDINFETGLTTACFLNSLGDILIGLKNHIFIIRHEGKLSWLSGDEEPKEKVDRPESEIYESPYLKYDIRRPVSPESENMERYLVPYQDMMFSSLGSWVVIDNDAPSCFSADERKDDDVISDDLSSNAPSDIYQSSIYSDVTDKSQTFWWLPQCMLSPEESIVSSDEDTLVDQDEILSNISQDEALAQKPIVDPKTKLESMLAQTEQRFEKGKKNNFTHVASNKLKKARIDAKALQKNQNAKLNRTAVVKKDVDLSSGTKYENKAKITRKITKKTSRPVDDRRKVSQKQKADTGSRTKEAHTEIIKDGENDEGIREKMTSSTDAIGSPDAGYQSQLSVINDDTLHTMENDEEPIENGVLISSSKPISLTKVSSHFDNNKDIKENTTVGIDKEGSDEVDEQQREQADEREINEADEQARVSPLVSNSKRSSRTQTASSSDSSKFHLSSAKTSASKQLINTIDQDNEFQQPPSLSSSSLSSYSGSASDFLSEDESDQDEEILSLSVDDITRTQDNISSIKSFSGKQKEHLSNRIQQEDIKVKVVPAFSQQLSVTVDPSSRVPSRVEQNIPLTVYSLSNRASSRVSSSRKDASSPLSRTVSRQQQQTPVKSPDEADKNKLSRHSKSPSTIIRVPFGQIDEKETFISSSTIKKETDEQPAKVLKIPEPKEKKKENLVDFFVSALKQKNKHIGRESPLRSITPKSPSNGVIIKDDNAEVIEQVLMHNSATKRLASPVQLLVADELDSNIIDRSQSPSSRQSNRDYRELPERHLKARQTKESYIDPIKESRLLEDLRSSHDAFQKHMQPLDTQSGLERSFERDKVVVTDTGQQDYYTDATTILTDSTAKNIDGARNDMLKSRKPVKTSEIFEGGNDVSEVRMDIYRRARSIVMSGGHKNEVSKRQDEYFRQFEDEASLSTREKKDSIRKTSVKGNSDGMPQEIFKRSKSDARIDFEGKPAWSELKRQDTRSYDGEEYTRKKFANVREEQTKFDVNSITDLQREGSKGKLIFVNVPLDDEKNDGKAPANHCINYREEALSPISSSSYDINTAKRVSNHVSEQLKSSCVVSLHEKLLKRRALNASMKKRQASAKFRREAIEKQKIARCQSKGVSPSFSQEYTTEFLPEAVPISDKVKMTYEYTTPVPLPDNTKKPSKVAYGMYGINKKSLEARLSGQPFRHGKNISKDENEDIILDFIKSSIDKDKKKVVLLPRPKSSPSIPARCHDYVLVKETNKHPKALSKLERDLLTKRFSEFSLDLT